MRRPGWEEKSQRKALWDFLDKQGVHRERTTLDPLQGLFQAQGPMLQHFAFAGIGLFILTVLEPPEWKESVNKLEGEHLTES